MSDPRTLAAEVGAKADLLGVALRSTNAELAPPDDVEHLEMTASWETSFQRLADSHIEYRYRIAVTDAQTETFYVRAEFALAYALSATSTFSDEHLDAFGDVSVAFSAFPYARELVQSLTSRASLPPLVLGTLRAPIDPPGDSVSTPAPKRAKSAKKADGATAGRQPSAPATKAAKRGARR